MEHRCIFISDRFRTDNDIRVQLNWLAWPNAVENIQRSQTQSTRASEGDIP